jgi:hypothetical protein
MRGRKQVVQRLPGPLRRRLERRWPSLARGRLRVRPGRHLPKGQERHVPVVMLVALGLDAAELEASVEAIAWQQTLHMSFVPLFVTDVADSRVFRRHEYLYEYIPSFADWGGFNEPELWPGFVGERLEELVDVYRPASVSTLGVEGPFGGVALGITPRGGRR